MTDPALPPLGATARAAYDALRSRIEAGHFSAVGRLPAERALAAELAISRGTLRQALARLAEHGVIVPAPQSGWHVVSAPLGEPPHTLISFTEMARRRGLAARTRVLDQRTRPATLDEAEQLRLPPAAPVLDLERVRSLGQTPVCLERQVISLAEIGGLADCDLRDRSLYDELAALGVRPYRSDFSVQAGGADARTAKYLKVEPGCPVLIGTESCADASGRPLILGRSTYRGDSYRFQATLFRRG